MNSKTFLVAAVLLTSLGCGGGGPVIPEDLTPTTGTIKVDGEIAAGVSIAFTPTDGTKGEGAWGVTDSQGQFYLKYKGESEGIQPGSYAVHLSRFLMPDGSPSPPDRAPHLTGAKQSIPPEWSDKMKVTPLNTVTIPKSGGKPLEFDIKTKKKK